MDTPPSRSARVVLAFWIGLILLLVTPWYGFRDHSHWAQVRWIPFVSPPVRLRDILLNIVFYIPFGYAFVRGTRGAVIWKAVAGAFLLSAATEVSQVYSHGRFPSTTDLVCNTAGAWLGALWAGSRRA